MGAETTPFKLPEKWDLEKLKDEVKRHIGRLKGQEVVIENLYYKKAKGKMVVKIEKWQRFTICPKRVPDVLSTWEKKGLSSYGFGSGLESK